MPSPGIGRFRVAAISGVNEGNMDGVDDFLNGPEPEVTEETVEAVAEVAETPEVAEEPKGPQRDDKGRFAPKGEKAEDASPASPEPTLDHPALLGERRRRQELEQRLADMEARLAQPAAQPVQQHQEQGPPDRWEDPEGYDQYLIERATKAAEERALHAMQTQRLTASANEARGKYQDYDDAINVFGELIQNQPGLYERMLQSPNPAEFAYTNAKTEMELRQHGGLDALVKAKVEAALAAQAPAPAPTPIPTTLANEQSARATAAIGSPPTLDSILGR